MSITVENISKEYGAQKALDTVSFSIAKGEIVGFLGPNGAGKSTLMKILTTYLQPSEGSAEVNGYSIFDAQKGVQQSVGYLPEHNPLYLDMYVREYLNFNADIYNIPKSDIEIIIEKTGLLPEAHKKIGSLSKGYRQRVGLATALLHNPDVLILDEPTTGLDPNQLIEIRELIKSVGKEKTVLLSTHIMQEVEAICDRVIIINHGKIVLDKRLDELKSGEQQIVEVEFDYRVETVALQKLDKVAKVDNPTGFVYHIHFDTKEDMRGKVFDFAHDNGLKILQLHQKNTTLEKLFIDLTTEK
ncbi:MAG: gliding motility-associated ABC transporter ATP-binding subunit GldA [Bacteroidia bacterium]|nr:gliding motility-associated ABC transporter ATP-binding subunit GldA [Bacteroidia bacterium]NNF31603.1 gliding motility-associated ABC transporter ATP-binding subunit GldA [Flavobacteriaceae bacterium]MBT8275261.1 gliding motility-associated ABC transporter ATP-binding subunit GldA [Bacteroidia bacterium]NNJ83239.1 gliding motility-associated ABC transporter ATP-binding subunit GldA [Flavobacteriaceae bacterium]NNK53293.1 gliding motility-associated ABC transporter ATP-binding subunit GldA [